MAPKVDPTPYLVDGEKYYMSLTKIMGKGIKDIEFYLVNEYGDASTMLHALVFEDGTKMHFEGEHDWPYLTTYSADRGGAQFPIDLNDLYDEDY